MWDVRCEMWDLYKKGWSSFKRGENLGGDSYKNRKIASKLQYCDITESTKLNNYSMVLCYNYFKSNSVHMVNDSVHLHSDSIHLYSVVLVRY